MKTLVFLLLTLLAATCVMGSEKLDLKDLQLAEAKGNFVEFEAELRKLLPPGSSETRVLQILKKIGWDSGFHKGHNLHYAGKKLRGNLLVKSKATIYIYLDQNSQVRKVDVTVANTSIFG